MRVLYLSDNISGHNRRFLEKIASFRHQVWFLDLSSCVLPPGWLPPGVQLTRLNQTPGCDASPSSYEGLVPEFQSVLARIQPDLIHAGPVQSAGYLAALSGFSPVLLMSWGSDILVQANQDGEWKTATEAALRGAAGFFCDCDAVRSAAKRIVAIDDSRIVQFPWGVERHRFAADGPRPAGLTGVENSFFVLSTRSWEPLYDIGVLLEAFELARKSDTRLRLILLGDGSQRNRIRDFILSRGLSDVVVAPGVIANSDLPKWFRAADVYLSCAKSDGTSVSLLEAMATGLPVVVTDIPSNREWVSNGENGWLAPASSVERFAGALLRAGQLSSEERAAIRERNQSAIAQRADWDSNFPALMEMYERIVSVGVRKA